MSPRRSARKSNASNASSSPPRDQTSPIAKVGTKRKAEDVASPKANKKAQKTLEETMPEIEKNGAKEIEQEEAPKNAEMKDASPAPEVKENDTMEKQADEDKKALAENAGDESANQDDKAPPQAKEEPKPAEHPVESKVETEEKNAETKISNETRKDSSNGDLAVKSPDREKKVASNIVEKGIIYFFTRGRVGIDNPESVQDLQRTFFVMRPIPLGSKLGDTAIPDTEQNRLVALPKKVFPKGGNDKFMAFVEKSKVSMKQLKDEFFSGSEYDTQTLGTRTNSPVTPIGEGVYALTEVGNSTHLAYMLTIPEKPEQVQDDLGLRERGSFVISLKNPTRKGPANATLDETPDYPKEFIDDFRGLAWMPVHKAEYLDYPNAQVLLIGEGQDTFGKAVEAPEKDKRDDSKESAEVELEKLEDEDQIRIDHLHGEDSVYDDLHISKKDYPALRTTW